MLHRFLAEYTSYMQLILVGAAIAVVPLLGWEAGKWIARRGGQAQRAITPAR